MDASIAGGTWSVTPTGIVTIDASGKVKGIKGGTAEITYITSGSVQCTSAYFTIVVNNSPVLSVENGYPSVICMGSTSTTKLSSNGAIGTWVSLTPGVATVHASTGVVTPVSAGTASFKFTETSTGCSDSIMTAITVISAPSLSFDNGKDSICIG